ncbi:MAG: sigma-70 family RNA polymerase sigma factor, partial [Flavobacteriaceae bacterium]|nr:sigma-70 family RNA polymerase sigma factor [Flavobacteriaceae bacterium]
GNSKFSTWLYSFAYNHCVNYVNRNTAKKIERKSVDSEGLEERLYDPAVDDREISQLRVDQLKNALDKISPDEKMILLLKYQDGLSIKELSANLEIGESAVKMRLKRAKEKLVTVYKEHEYGQSI